jgi:long-chain acyl-CoA synthetase
MSAVGGFNEIPILPTDRHLSYLPLPHIFERIVIAQALTAGASVAFFRGDPLLLVEDIVACRPTMIPVVPRVLNKIHDKIMAGMAAKGGLTEKMFRTALKAKSAGLQEGKLTHALWDRILFHKIKAALGLDCIRFMVSGSAPLSPNVMTFFRCLLGVPVMEGYGQTEGSAAATISHPEDVGSVGHVGGPVDCVEVVLMDVPEMGYLSTGKLCKLSERILAFIVLFVGFLIMSGFQFNSDTSHQGEPCRGRGEICVRGPNVFKGYYKDEEKTKETIDEEGWLHSGDVGLWTMEGQLKIIDRKKNIFKLAQGGEMLLLFHVANLSTNSYLNSHTSLPPRA